METWVYVAGWTLVHFVWQGALIAGGAAIGFYLLRGAAANLRYLLASAALGLMLVSLAATAYVVSSPATTPTAMPASRSFSVSTVLTPLTTRLGARNGVVRSPAAGARRALQRLPQAFPVIVVTWLTGVAILLTRLLGAWWRVRALQRIALIAPLSRWQATADRIARKLGVRGRVRVSDTDMVDTPTVIGWWRPVVLLPVTALSGLTPSQADAILAHELAHIRRHDYLVNLLQHVVETILFYHPAVWWLSHRMRAEREQCCDATVVRLCADPLDYATALTRLEEARRTHSELVVAATGGRLLDRVRRLLNARTDRHPTAHAVVTGMLIALVVLGIGGGYRWSSTLHAHARETRPIETLKRPSLFNATPTAQPIQIAGLFRAPAIQPVKTTTPQTAHAEPPQQNAVSQSNREASRPTPIDNERQLENALTVENPVTDMSLAVEVNYFQLNRAEYTVPITIRIPGSELALARSQGATRTTIEFAGEVKDAYGIPIQNLRDRLDIRLSDDGGAQFEARPIQYEPTFTMLPGTYSLRIAALNAETGRIGTFRASFQIPNLNREEKALPISTVVLGSQLVSLNQDAQPDGRPNPLLYNGQKLVPNVTRVFSANQDMYVFLQAYERDATTTQPLVAFVTLYRDGVKAAEAAPLRVTDGLQPRSKAVPVQLKVSLSGLAPGPYDCEVTVVEPGGPKVAVWRTRIVLVQ